MVLNLVLMNVFDFYKFIITDLWSYLTFLAFMLVMYLFFCLTVSFVVEQICKIIAYCRAPVVRNDTKE